MIYSDVECYEEHGTVKENVDHDKTTCSVTLRCSWGNRWALIADLLGYRRPWPALADWARPPRAKTAAIAASATDYETVGQGCVYIDALVSVNYTNEISDEDYCAESLEPTVEFLKEDFRRFRWGSAQGEPLLEGEAPGRQVRGMSLVRQLYHLRSVPLSLLVLGGTVNRTPFASRMLGITFPAETLLFNPPQISTKTTSKGDDGFDLTVKYTFNQNGWNRYWRQASQSYEEMYMIGSSEPYKPYPPANQGDFLY